MALNVGELFGTLTIKGTSQAVRSLDEVQASFTQTGAAAGRAGGLIDESSAALTGAGKAANLASAGSARFRQAQLQLFAATEKYTALLDDENASLAQLARAEATVIGAQERLNKAMASGAVDTKAAGAAATETEGRFASMRASMASTLEMAGKLGLALGAFELVKKAIDITKEASEYQRSMTQIRTLTGASADEVKTMSTALLGLSGQVAQSPADLATSLYHMESVGLHGAKALDAVRIAAEGAKIGNADLEETTNALTSTIASGIAGNQNYSKTMSQLLTIVGTGDMKLSDFNASLGSGVLAIVHQYGISLRDVGAALAVFGDNNIRGAHAATMLRMTVQGFAVPAATAQAAFDKLGMTYDELNKDMQSGGLNKALLDLKAHLDAAGISGKQTGQILTEIVGKRAGAGAAVLIANIDRLQSKYAMLDQGAQTFGQRWDETTKTAAFKFDALGAAAQATGIKMANAILPATGAIAGGLLTGLTDVAHALGAMWPVIKVVGAAWIGMWAGRAALVGIQASIDAVVALKSTLSGMSFAGLAGAGGQMQLLAANVDRSSGQISGAIYGTAAEADRAAAIMRADFAEIGAAATAYTAAFDQVAADQAEAWAIMVAASDDATATMIANAQNTAAAAQEMAAASAAAAAEAATAAETAATGIAAAGDTARVGWVGLAGPLGAAALGIFAIVSMFHKSSGASKEATDAAKAYTDALSGSDASKTTLVDTIMTQLSNNGLPQMLDQLNKALGKNAFTGGQFVTAIESSGKPLDDLRGRLQAIIDAGTKTSVEMAGHVAASITIVSPAAKAATAALKQLNTQFSALSTGAKNELNQAKKYDMVASSIDNVSQSTHVASKTAQTYAEMAGIVVDKNGIAAVSSKTLTTAVESVSAAYKKATASGQNFLSALQTFSASAGTAADRAQLIGATLVAANGDALNFASQMNAASGAVKQLGTDIASAAKSVGKSGESTKAYIDSIVNLKKGTIDYHKSAAAPLINDMQSMQTAAMNAAEAVYQHARATETGTQAADKAYKAYKAQTSGQLVDELTKLTGNAAAAKKLADQYFGMPSKVKTLIEQEGANPVVTVLNKIGRLLADLVGKPWNVDVKSNASQVIEQINGIRYAIDRIPSSKNVLIRTVGGGDTASARASGGQLPNGWASVGEQGPELAHTAGGKTQILSNSQSKAYIAATGLKAPGFAGGTSPSGPFNIGGLAGSVVKGIESAMAHLLPPALSRLGQLIAHGLAAVSVSTAIAKSVRPASTSPSALASQLNTATAGATNKTASESTALVYYQSTKKAAADLQKTLDRLKASDAADAQAARNHASALSTEAANIHGTTKADEARKKALEDEARAASNAATKIEQANKRHETALGKVVTAANNTAAKAKTAYGKIKTAADNATQAAEQDAQNLISAIDQQFSDLQTKISDFVSSISGDLTAGSDLATVWGDLGTAVQTASDNLTTAQQNLQSAKDAVTQATPDTTAYTQAMQAQADALDQVNAAHAALVQAQQSGNQTGILAAQQAQTAATEAYTTAMANAVSAQQSLASAAAPTADQLQAVTDAQTALTKAQDDYNQAVAADTVTGLQAKFNSLLANTQKFASDLTALQQQAGNSQAAQSFISQIAGMGVDAGDALAQQLLAAGPTGVSALVSTMGSIQDVADQSGAQLAQGFYGQGVSALQKLIQGIEDEFPDLVAALQPYLTQLQAMFTITPTVTVPGTSNGTAVNPPKTNPKLTTSQAQRLDNTVKGLFPGFANGVSNFAGGIALVGERGPELVTLPSGASVIPNQSLQSGAVTATLHPDDRALLQDVAQRPVELWMNDRGKTKIGEVANDHRQTKRLAGNGRFR